MTLYLRHPSYPRWCRLREAGGSSHLTVCSARISASDPTLITSTPPDDDICDACRTEIVVNTQKTIDEISGHDERKFDTDAISEWGLA